MINGYLPFWSSCRKAEVKRRAAINVICGSKFSPMREHDALTDGQTKAHSFLFSSKERLKQLFDLFRRNAASPVGNRYGDRAVIILDLGTNNQAALRCVAASHRVASIDYQIDQDLL